MAPDNKHASHNICLHLTNSHCTGIDNETIKHDIATKNKVDLFKIDIDTQTTNYVLYEPDMYEKLLSGEIQNNVILDENHDISILMEDIIKKTKYCIEQFQFRTQSQISAFIHPISKKLIIENNQFEMRKSICNKAFEIYKNDELLFKNQTVAQIVSKLFKYKIGCIQKSSYNQNVMNVIDEFRPIPITRGYSDKFNESNTLGFDTFKCYSSILFCNDMNIPLYNTLCDLKDYDGRDICCGEYLIDNIIINKFKGDHPFLIYAGLYSWNLIKYLIDNNFMKKSQIKKMLLPCGELPYEIFKDFVEFIYNNFQEDEAKSLINVFIGNTGSIYNKDIRGCIVDSLIEACSLQAMYENVEIYPFTYIIFSKTDN